MTDGETASIGNLPQRRARLPYLAGAILLLVVALVALWLARKPVAEHFIDDALRTRGVPARYEIEKVGLRTQRLTNVRIGDPAHPDLLANWVEVDTSLWFSGARVSAIRVGRVQIRARLTAGKVSFGTLDRLLPTSGKPFALPSIRAEIADARIALSTPQGDVALTLAGAGNLVDGFAGTLDAAAARLDIGECRLDRATASLQVRIAQTRPSLSGPLLLAHAACNGAQVTRARANLAVALNSSLDRWKGSAQLGLAALALPGATLRAVAGPVTFVGKAEDVTGALDLHSGLFATASASGAAAALTGRYRYANRGLAFDGAAQGLRVALPSTTLAQFDRWRGLGAGTPIGPIAAQMLAAAQAAGRTGKVDAWFSAIVNQGRGQIIVSRAAVASASGVRAAMVGGGGITYRWPGNIVRIDSAVTVKGGGLPSVQAQLTQAGPGAPLTGRALVSPYGVDTSRLILTPIDFVASRSGTTRVTTRATLTGPLGNGRIDALSLPLTAAWDGGSRLTVNPGCAPLAFARLRVAGLDLRRSSVTLCPRDGALVRLERGRLGGGGRIGPIMLGGTLGSSPLDLTSRSTEWRLNDGRFAVTGLNVRFGTSDRLTRLALPALSGSFSTGAAQGAFSGASGQIGNVPLFLSGADGRWRFSSGRLGVTSALTVVDTAANPRFKPLAARGITLTLANNRIAATGTLFEFIHNAKVADVAIVHDLGAGTGKADLTVTGITFGDRFQPDQLTRFTFGVIANVVGSVSGEGHIQWSPRGVTSDGVFRTAGTDLAAAFGPATGIAGEVRFTDLLTLKSAPGQIATIKSLNPGVPVNDGTIRYQLLPGERIAIEQGRWPFAGGTLTLEPTLLDFGQAQERRMTFRVTGMEAAQFLQQFDFKNLNATGVFDGTLPMIFDASGGRIEGGHLVVRPGGGTVAYVGEVTQKNLGFWGNFAFQSLKSLRYRDLDIVMNGPLAGEVTTEVRFAGIGQGAGAKRNFLFDRLQKLPIIFNVRIKAPFRQLIDSAESFYDPKRLIVRNLPALIEEQNRRAQPPKKPLAAPVPVQPSDSRNVP